MTFCPPLCHQPEAWPHTHMHPQCGTWAFGLQDSPRYTAIWVCAWSLPNQTLKEGTPNTHVYTSCLHIACWLFTKHGETGPFCCPHSAVTQQLKLNSPLVPGHMPTHSVHLPNVNPHTPRTAVLMPGAFLLAVVLLTLLAPLLPSRPVGRPG
jgi:hypothetical protein